jgi:hypothetical protein
MRMATPLGTVGLEEMGVLMLTKATAYFVILADQQTMWKSRRGRRCYNPLQSTVFYQQSL